MLIRPIIKMGKKSNPWSNQAISEKKNPEATSEKKSSQTVSTKNPVPPCSILLIVAGVNGPPMAFSIFELNYKRQSRYFWEKKIQPSYFWEKKIQPRKKWPSP